MKIGIVGTGMVGATTGYAIVMRGIGRELILVDINASRAQAEADDILHSIPFASSIEVSAGDYADLEGCRVVVITAGANQRPGESRLDLLGRNAQIFKEMIPAIVQNAPEAIYLVATNPVDILTHLTAFYAQKHGIPSSRVIGSGTTLDTARFRALLGRKLGVDAQHVHAYVLGEHGDSEVLTWSLVTIGGIPLDDFCRLRNLSVCAEDKELIDNQVRQAAYSIIQGKGATYYGIGSALARIVEVILRDQRSILTICTPAEKTEELNPVTFSLPRLVGGDGVIATLYPSLSVEEEAALKKSALIIHQALEGLNF